MSQRSEKLRRAVEQTRADIDDIQKSLYSQKNRLDKAAMWASDMDKLRDRVDAVLTSSASMTARYCRRCTPPRRYPGCQCAAKPPVGQAEGRCPVRTARRGGLLQLYRGPDPWRKEEIMMQGIRPSAGWACKGLPATFLPPGTGDQPPASGRGPEPSLRRKGGLPYGI